MNADQVLKATVLFPMVQLCFLPNIYVRFFEQIDHFMCKSSGDCINEKDLCDGDSDCTNSDDESYLDDGPCNVNANNCTFKGESGFVCDGNRCLRKQVICDGIAQCKDGSDEHYERCAVSTCPPNNFQCKQSKQCIPRSFVCDGHPDCRLVLLILIFERNS